MKEFFKEWRPSPQSESLIIDINDILEDYEKMGYKLTLRQLYYQLVSRDIIPNSTQEYNKIGNVVSNGRMSGLIDWSMIEDRVRIPKSRSHWDNPKDVIESAAYSYYRKRWETQSYYVEVWCEKDAVSNIIEPVCSKYDVTFMANRGYSSMSAMYEASKRIKEAMNEGKAISIIYVGDHDPSGIDMTRDIDERLGVFTNTGKRLGDVNRVALNMDQVEEYNPPKNPAKMTDSRFSGYVEKFGYSSWELDALEPKVLESIIENKIRSYITWKQWDKVEDLEKTHKNKLNEIAENFDNISFGSTS